jgi:uncharacterized protein (TIGR02266 family)
VTASAADRPIRVPFVRACHVHPGEGSGFRAFTANMSVLGAYLASDEPVRVNQTLRLSFTVPGNVIESQVVGVVAWTNPKQQHPVHSLPPGFGVRFLGLDPDTRRRIEVVVAEYVARQPGPK